MQSFVNRIFIKQNVIIDHHQAEWYVLAYMDTGFLLLFQWEILDIVVEGVISMSE